MSNNFDGQSVWRTSQNVTNVDQGLKDYMVRVYCNMSLGLLLTALIAFAVSRSPELLQVLFGSPLRWVVAFAPLGIVFFLGAKINSMKSDTARVLFFVYSALVGIAISSIFPMYKDASIAKIFFIASSIFGGMSLYGYTTKKDLTSMGNFLIMGVWGLIIASVINMIFPSSAMSMALSVLAVFIFTGLTAYDTQKIKEIYYSGDSSEISNKKAILGSLSLYIDFLNIFLSLLRLFGERRD